MVRNMSKWKIIDRGSVPEYSGTIPYSCPGCGADSELPVAGMPIAQIGNGVVFDSREHAIPKIIQCRKCRRKYGVS